VHLAARFLHPEGPFDFGVPLPQRFTELRDSLNPKNHLIPQFNHIREIRLARVHLTTGHGGPEFTYQSDRSKFKALAGFGFLNFSKSRRFLQPD
ncbi:hypothetical protein K0M31_002832, partial [Melipona bicolor]